MLEPHWVATLVLVGFAVGGALVAYLIAAVRLHADGATAGDNGGGDVQEPPADEVVVEELDAPSPIRVIVPRKRVTRRTRSLL